MVWRSIRKNRKEGKLINEIIGILEEVGYSIEDLEDSAAALGEEIDAISDDLSDVEEVVFDDEQDEDDDFFTVECPTCGKELIIDEDTLAEGVVQCPGCADTFALDLSDVEDEEEESEE